MLEVDNAGYAIGDKWLVKNVSASIQPGQFWAIVGANGSGKSTLLRLITGEYGPHNGVIRINGIPLPEYPPQALARLRACLAQVRDSNFPFTAYEIAMMGRLPWQQGWSDSADDHAAVEEAMERTGATAFARRSYPTLSGGEQTRVDLARTLAQEPRLLLLDEPTNHLDVHHQLSLMEVCRNHTAAGGIVVAVLHDLNLAARHADQMLMLHEGNVAAAGKPESVLTCENLRRYFGLECEVWRHPAGCPWVIPTGYCEAQQGTASVWELNQKQRAACAV